MSDFETEAALEAAYAHNDRRVRQEDFYAIACDPKRSVVVEACAGAGKTWMLVSRMVRALLDGAQPHELLAITFTKKAAGEMRQRLYQWAYEWSTASDEALRQALLDRGLGANVDSIQLDRMRALHQTLMQAQRPVQVRTFHAWFATLVRSAPVGELMRWGLPAQYTLLEDDSRLVAQVWRRFHRRVAQDASARSDFEEAVAAYGRHQTQKALEAALSKRVEFALADAQGVVQESVQTFGQAFADMAHVEEPLQMLMQTTERSAFDQAARCLGAASQATASKAGSKLEQALEKGDALGIFDALLTKNGEARSFKDSVQGIEIVRTAQATLLRIGQAQNQHRAWQHQQRMVRLTRGLLQDYAQLKRERALLDMNDLELSAYRLLSDPRAGAWIQERLDARVRHLLVDEFQDTNPLQWKALEAWIASYAGAARAPSVFIVGDPKQSIYRFRRAEPQVFQEAKRFVIQGLDGDSLSCEHTRRNAQAITQLVNGVFTPLLAQGEFEGFRSHSTASSEPGQVLKLPQIRKESSVDGGTEMSAWRDSLTTPRHVQEDTRKVLECRQVAQWLAQAFAQERPMGPLRPADVMVLARKRERLSLLKVELDALRIPAQFAEKTELNALPEVQDLLALIDALVSPRHDLSLAQALKSPLFATSDELLVQWVLHLKAIGWDRSRGWLDALFSEVPLTPDLSQAFAPVVLQLRRWQSLLMQRPPHDALAAIYREGDVVARYCASAIPAQRASVQAHLDALLGAAMGVDGGRFLTAYAFVRALRAGGYTVPQRAAPDALQLLTVHGAKGLEAPLVLVLDADSESPKSETMGVLVQWPGQDSFPRKFVFLASESAPPPCCAQLMAQELQAREREERNALYVTLTRAKNTLAFSAMEPHRQQPRSWWAQVQAHATEVIVNPMQVAPYAGPEHAQADDVLLELSPLPDDLRTPQAPPPVATSADLALDLDARLGQAMHCLLEHYAPQPGSKHGLWSEAAWQLAQTQFALDAPQMALAAQAAQSIVQGEGAWAWDWEILLWQGNEINIYHQGRNMRMDRLVQRKDTGHWWILDYKSSARPDVDPVLCAQLAGYRAAVQMAYPAATIRAAFLTPQGRLIEPDPHGLDAQEAGR